ESDFNFISRLAEEEGFYYFFEHAADGESMTFSNAHASKSGIAKPEGDPEVILEEAASGDRREGRVTSWEKTQEIRSGKYTVWDHSFQLPQSHLEAEKTIQSTVAAGSVSHRLDKPFGQTLEIYDYPGGYAKRRDGVKRGGGENPDALQAIFEDNKKTAAIRMQQETLDSVRIHGTSTYPFFRRGPHFDLLVDDPSQPGRRKADGEYALTHVRHQASQPLERSGNGPVLHYANEFDAMPSELYFQPARRTPRPIIAGTRRRSLSARKMAR